MRLADRVRGDSVFPTNLARYAFSVLAVAVALALRIALTPLTGAGAPFVLFFGATLVTSLVAGVGPAVLSLALSLPLGAALYVVPAGFTMAQAAVQACLYAADGFIIVYITVLTTRRRLSLQELNRQLQLANDERERTLARVRETVELAPDAYFLSDLDACFTDVNQAACRLLGYERDELIGKTIFDIIPSEDAARLKDLKTELMVPGKVSTAEWTQRRKDGTLVPVEVSSNILPDGRWQAFVRDISERKRVEDMRQVYVALLDNSSDFIGIADPTEKPIYLNAAGRRMIGLTPDYPVDRMQIQDCYPPELHTFVTDVLLKTMVERGQWSGETFFQNVHTHAKIPVSDTHFVIRDASGKRILGFGTVTRDISDARRIAEEREQLLAQEHRARQEAESANAQLRKSEEALRLSEAKFSGIVSIGADAIISVDKEQRITIFNEGAEATFGYTKDEVIGTAIDRLIPERFRAAHRAGFAGFAAGAEAARTMDVRKELYGLRKNGEEFPAEGSISKVTVGGVTFFSVVLRDVTYRKRVEEALQRALTARDDVLGIVAHDLRNPLNTILMQASALEHPEPERERRDQTPRLVIMRSAKRMNALIQDLLDVAVVEAGQFKVEHERLSAVELAREAVETQTPVATSAGVELRLEIGSGVDQVLGDRNRLLQVFDNLVGNAIKFTKEGGHIVVRAVARGDEVQFSIADSGAGIAPDSVPHIFDRFWQAATRERRLGAGLGLPITKGIVEAHGGRIWVESTVGQGTTFFFTIPAATAEASINGGERGHPAASHDGQPKTRAA